MPVMRSVFYVPGNNEGFIAKAPGLPADIITLDLEDSVPPAEKPKAREMVRENLKLAGSGGSTVYVRINNWETLMTNDDLEAVVYPGLSGICLRQVRPSRRREAPRLEARRAGAEARYPRRHDRHPAPLRDGQGRRSTPIPRPWRATRVNSLIFGAVDYTKDMRVKLTSEGEEQLYARFHIAVAARAAGRIAIDCPFVAFQDTEGYEKSVLQGRQMGYEGRMLIHPSQIEPSNRLYAPSAEDVEWARGVVKVFEEEGLAKGAAAVSYKGKMVDTPVYDNARTILSSLAEIEAFDKKRKKG